MKRKLHILLLAMLLPLLNSNVHAQDTIPCLFDTILQQHIQGNPKLQNELKYMDFRVRHFREQNTNLHFYPKPQPEPPCDMCFMMDAGCATTKYVVPVLVHIVHLTSDNTIGTGSNIPNEQVDQAMVTLNKQFSGYGVTDTMAVNTGIQFYLAPVGPNSNGIFRYANNMSNHTGHKDSAAKLLDLIDSQYRNGNYINLFIVNQINNPAVKGYATMPGKFYNHLITIAREYFGDYNNCTDCDLSSTTNGKTIAHEFGHYLGLYHTFHDSCQGGTPETCDTEGDKCCDTPPVAKANSGCSGTPPNSCAGTSPDQIENFMDYAGDACTYWFTRNQAERMHYTLEYERPDLIDIEQLITHDPDICFLSARFRAIKNVSCDTGTMVLKAIPFQSSGVEYHWTIYDNLDNVVYSKNDTDNHIFSYFMNTEGFYHVKLKVIYDGDTATETVNKLLWVANCADAIESEQGNWYFGARAGLVFTETGTRPSLDAIRPPNPLLPPTINSHEGGISISNAQGELMFYAGGNQTNANEGQVFNSDHERINSHRSVNLHISGTAVQNAITFPCPLDTSKMMLLQNNANGVGAFSYTLLKKNTQGKFELDTPSINTLINVPGFNNDTFRIGEYLSAAPKCDGIGHWVAVVATHGTADSFNTLFILSIDSNGISVADTQFLYLSKYHPSDSSRTFYGYGQAKFSPDATKLALYKYIWDFNRKTGEISNRVEIPDNKFDVFGLTFSPNSRYLYWINIENNSLFRLDLSQRDFESNIERIGFAPNRYSSASMQIGPDNKIYIASPKSDFLGVINSPDIPMSATPNPLGYEPNGAALKIGTSGGRSEEGLPNFVDAKKEELVKDTIFYTISNCNQVQFSTTACCRANFKWIFGDGDTSNQRIPEEHTYASYGGYTVYLVLDAKDTISVQIPMNPPTVSILGADTICYYGQQLIYQAKSQFTEQTNYIWTMGNDTLLGPPGQPDLAYISIDSIPNTIKVFAYDPVRDCSATDTLNVVYSAGIENNIINQGKAYFVFNDIDSSDYTMEGSTPSGGDESFIYRWYSSKDSITWTELTGQTGQHLASHTSDTVLHLKRIVESELCERPSNIVKAYLITKNNTIGDSASIVNCGDDSIFISGTNPIDGLGIYKFEWFISDNGTDWDLIEEENDTTYEYPIVSLNKYYRRVVYSGYDTLYSNTLLATSGILNNFINNGSDTTILFDYNDSPNLDIVGSEAAAIETVTYQWYMSIDSADWQPISGKTFQDLEFDELQTISWFYRQASISGCNTQSNIVKVFYALLDSNTIGDSAIVVFCPGDSLTVIGSTPYGGVNNFQYKWFESANGTSWTQIAEETRQHIDFAGIAQIKYIKRSVISGLDSIESNVVQFIPRIRSNSQNPSNEVYFCPSTDTSINFSGSTPIIFPTESPSYQWYISSDSVNFSPISGQTAQNLNISTADYIVYLFREVTVAGCVSQSSTAKIIPAIQHNKVFIETPACQAFYDSRTLIKGETILINNDPGATYEYKWQQSDFGTTWNDIQAFKLNTFGPTFLYNPNRIDRILNDIPQKHYRRVISIGTCKSYSNEVEVINYTIDTIKNINLDVNNTEIAIGAKKIEPDSLFKVTWQTSCNGEGWENIEEDYHNDTLWNVSNYFPKMIRRKIVTLNYLGIAECDSVYSYLEYEIITSHPASQSINVGESADFWVEYISTIPFEIQWQKYNASTQVWEDMAGKTDPSLSIFGDQCNNQSQYRAKLSNSCRTLTTNAATLTVNNPYSDYFLWLKDNPADIASEPNNLINVRGGYMLSPDILVSHDSFLIDPGAWPHRTSASLGYYDGVYIHTIVRNNGTDTSKGGKLFLYAGLAGSNNHWDFSFSNVPQGYWFGNTNHLNYLPGLQTPTPTFGTPINFEGIEIPNIPPGGIDTIVYHWNHAPEHFKISSISHPHAGSNIFTSKNTITYLARIENCEEAPHNMTYQEHFYPNKEHHSAYLNIKNNARIAAIHSHKLPMKGPRNLSTNLTKLPDQWTLVTNDYNSPYTIVINSDSTDHFYSTAEMYVYFDQNLWNAFVLGGYAGAGYTIIEPGIFRIDTLVPAYWDNISLAQDSVGYMGYSLHYKPGAAFSGLLTNQLFLVEFSQGTELVGELYLHTQSQVYVEPAALREDESLSNPAPPSPSALHHFTFLTNPNPFGNELNIYIRGFEEGANVVMYDMNAKEIATTGPSEGRETVYRSTISTNHLAEGVYFIRYQSNSKQVVKKVVLVRQ